MKHKHVPEYTRFIQNKMQTVSVIELTLIPSKPQSLFVKLSIIGVISLSPAPSLDTVNMPVLMTQLNKAAVTLSVGFHTVPHLNRSCVQA